LKPDLEKLKNCIWNTKIWPLTTCFNTINKLYYIIYYNVTFTSSYELWHGLVVMTTCNLSCIQNIKPLKNIVKVLINKMFICTSYIVYYIIL